MLAFHLPAGAQLWSDLGSDRAWTVESHLTALVADQLAGANWQRGGGKGPQPKPIPRPSDTAQADQKADRYAERAQRFREQREG